jgi:hypothetical protein
MASILVLAVISSLLFLMIQWSLATVLKRYDTAISGN